MDELGAFLGDLASGDPVPGGGSVAAIQVAMGAALLSMVCNLTLGRKRYAGVEDRVRTLLARSEALLADARRLADEDARAYGSVADAMSLPRATDDERSSRTREIQGALKAAVQPPLDCMRTAMTVLDTARELVPIGNMNAVSDVGVAALSTVAGFEAARLNVDINLKAIKDVHFVDECRTIVLDIGDPIAGRHDVLRQVNAIVRGESA